MLSTDLSTFDNSWYHPGKNKLVQMMWYFTNILVITNPLNPFSSIRKCSLRFFGAKIGKGVVIKPGVRVKYPWRLKIGNNSWIGESVWIDNLADVVIGNNVCISQGAMLLCGNHNYKSSGFDLITGDIVLEDGVWIGARAIVAPGVSAGSHSILTVNSVATKNLESGKIYSGNPAAIVRERILYK